MATVIGIGGGGQAIGNQERLGFLYEGSTQILFASYGFIFLCFGVGAGIFGRKWWVYPLTGACLFTIVFGQSRSIYLGLTFALIVTQLLLREERGRRRSLILAGSALFTYLALYALSTLTSIPFLNSIGQSLTVAVSPDAQNNPWRLTAWSEWVPGCAC